MAFVSDGAVSKIRSYVAKIEATRDKVKAKAQEKAGEIKATLEVQGSCAVSCYVIGRIEQKTGKPVEVFGLPVDLIAGGSLVGLAMLDFVGKYDEDALNVGNGILAGFVARKAYAMGQSAQQKGNLFGAEVIAGRFSERYGVGGVNDADARMAADIRRTA